MIRIFLPFAMLALSSAPAHAQEAAAPAQNWWSVYHDPVLDRLVDRALAANPDVEGALARIDQARAMARSAGAARLPSGQVSGSIARAEQSIDNGLGRLSRYVPTLARTQDAATLSASLGWDLDLAGGLRNGARAARADLVSAQAGLAATRLAIAAEVVGQYLVLRAAQQQVALVEEQISDRADRLRHAEARLARQEGSARERDERAIEAGAVDAGLPLLKARIAAARYSLAMLMGEPADRPVPELAMAGDLPTGDNPMPATPADLLRQRPDIVMAEARVVGSKARVGAALGEYWPHITLGGLFGFDTSTLATFGAGSSRVTQGFVGLRWRLFDFARVDAEVAAARGARREALAAYRAAVLKAGAQVETSFAALVAQRQSLVAQQMRLAAAEAAYGRSLAALRLGEISKDQHRGASLVRLAASNDVLMARLAVAQAVLECQKALGGAAASPS